eukprot:CAMPEP_0116879400 /NCGR_PEP_ID=MMETSP0463-20121206/11202_1 /TAXON_ID=181622 /ORGANISM="Strombidinopsis sp, Strain SopsisLIS2011" /LENGTH=118 /DNA_ID=CAMNT_0004528687 /DNA_START=233 /DNA_END=589 /DNA_ORIENTATION=+
MRKTNQVVVQGANYKYKIVDDEEYIKRKKTIQKEYPIHVSNVGLIDPELNRAVRVRTAFTEDGAKVRVSTKTGNVIPKPDRADLKYITRTKEKEATTFDTDPKEVLKKTYRGEDFLLV